MTTQTANTSLAETLDEIEAVLRQTSQEESALEAQWIACDVMRLANRSELYIHRRLAVDRDRRIAMIRLAQQRAAGMPLQYVLGKQEFYSIVLRVRSGCLIPRPETEILVDKSLVRLNSAASPSLNVLDIGTGSGNIAVALATFCECARITAIDISGEALVIAGENVRALGLQPKIDLVHASAASWRREEGFFDLVVSNPPYIAREDWETLPDVVRRFEPRIALDGGHDGLEIIEDVIECAAYSIKPGGQFLLEFGAQRQQEAVCRTVMRYQKWDDVRVHRDLAGRPRVLSAVRRASHG